MIEGTPVPDHDETVDVGWFRLSELDDLDLAPYNRPLLDRLFPAG